METLTIKEAVLLEDFNSDGMKLYWAEVECSDPYLDIDSGTGGAIKPLGEGGYLIKTKDNLISGCEIFIINIFNFDSNTIRTLQKLCKQQHYLF